MKKILFYSKREKRKLKRERNTKRWGRGVKRKKSINYDWLLIIINYVSCVLGHVKSNGANACI